MKALQGPSVESSQLWQIPVVLQSAGHLAFGPGLVQASPSQGRPQPEAAEYAGLLEVFLD